MICTSLLQILALFTTLCHAGFVHSVNHRYDIISSQRNAHIEVNVLISCERLSPGYTCVTMSADVRNDDSARFTCGVCTQEVIDFGARAVACNTCDRWIHKLCVGMLTEEYETLAESSMPWYCPDCGTPNHSTVIYDIPVSDSSHSSFSFSSFSSNLSPTSPETCDPSIHTFSSISDTSLHSVGSPGATSSPKPSATQANNKKSLRILVINFQSVRKKGKNIDVLVESTHPDIIFGTETWLSGDIPSTYFFNPQLGYTVHRHDRPNDPHGGVLIAVKNDLELTNIQKGKEVELIAGIVNISKTKKMLLCSYYRPPDKTSEEYLNMVKEEFTDLRKKFKNAVFIIGGDFNLPDINWNKNTVTNKSYPYRVSQTFLDIAQELGLEQMVDFPTRQDNTLDLVLTSHPGFKIRCKPLPPIGPKSDHDIVLFDTSHQPYRARPTRRKIFLWKKADFDGLRSTVAEASRSFLSTLFDDIEVMWTAFKTTITSALDKHVPTKLTSTRHTHPWVNTNLRRLMRRKQRAHRKAKQTGQPRDWERFKRVQAEVQRSTRKAHRSHMQDVVSADLKEKPKRFWSYIKSRRQEASGVAPLINKDGFLKKAIPLPKLRS